MSKLYLKGINQPIKLSPESGKKWNDAFLDIRTPDNTIINTPEFSGEKGMVKGVMLVDEEDANNTHTDFLSKESERIDQMQREYEKEVLTLRNLPKETKAKNIRIASMLYISFSGNEPDEEFIANVKKIQVDYFNKHPYDPYIDPSCFRHLLPNNTLKQKDPDAATVAEIAPLSMLQFVMRTREEAFRTIKQLGYSV